MRRVQVAGVQKEKMVEKKEPIQARKAKEMCLKKGLARKRKRGGERRAHVGSKA